jgi:hypothetical protein
MSLRESKMNLYLIFLLIGTILVLFVYFRIDQDIEKFQDMNGKEKFTITYPELSEIKSKVASKEYFSFFKLLDSQTRGFNFDYNSFKDSYEPRLIDFNQEDKINFDKFYSDVVESIPLKKRHVFLRPQLKIAKGNMLENGYPHTHSDIIVFDNAYYNQLKNYQDLSTVKYNAKVLIHEIVHIKQRDDPTFYDNLYKEWGFQSMSYQYLEKNVPTNIVSRIRVNPDELPHYRFWVWKNKVIPLVIYSSFEVSKINQIEFIGCEWNGKENITNYSYLEDYDDFIDFFGITNNHYHPNEILAEYQSIYYTELQGEKVDDDIINSDGYKIYKKFVAKLEKNI